MNWKYNIKYHLTMYLTTIYDYSYIFIFTLSMIFITKKTSIKYLNTNYSILYV